MRASSHSRIFRQNIVNLLDFVLQLIVFPLVIVMDLLPAELEKESTHYFLF